MKNITGKSKFKERYQTNDFLTKSLESNYITSNESTQKN